MYVADTHAWVGYLLGKLPRKADEVFLKAERAEEIILIPTIALAECVYLAEAERISLDFDELFSNLRIAGNFLPFPLTLEVVERLPKVALHEIHDRIMVATAQLLDAQLISGDNEIRDSNLVRVVWA